RPATGVARRWPRIVLSQRRTYDGRRRQPRPVGEDRRTARALSGAVCRRLRRDPGRPAVPHDQRRRARTANSNRRRVELARRAEAARANAVINPTSTELAVAAVDCQSGAIESLTAARACRE